MPASINFHLLGNGPHAGRNVHDLLDGFLHAHEAPELYLERKALAAEAAERAQETHRERREQESEDAQASEEAKVDRVEDMAYAREVRAAEIEFERMENERRGIDAEAERKALAKERRDAAAAARDEDLATAEADRTDAITTAAQQAAETLKEHADELAAANDVTSAQYKTLVNTKVDTAERMTEYRTEREIEQAKIDEERRGAAALMAQQARETRMMREQENDDQPVAPSADKSEIRALAALMGSSKPKEKPPVEPPVKAIDAVRRELESLGTNAVDTAEVVEPADEPAVGPSSPGFFGNLLRSLRRVA